MMNDRRDPFEGMGKEPVQELGLVDGLPKGLARRRNGRETAVRPAEKRRRARRINVTFSDAEIPERLRALARAWGLVASDGKSPNVSAVVEELLVPALERAEGDLSDGEGIRRE